MDVGKNRKTVKNVQLRSRNTTGNTPVGSRHQPGLWKHEDESYDWFGSLNAVFKCLVTLFEKVTEEDKLNRVRQQVVSLPPHKSNVPQFDSPSQNIHLLQYHVTTHVYHDTFTVPGEGVRVGTGVYGSLHGPDNTGRQSYCATGRRVF
ncbi:hypothetical protein CBL_08506 [Carabus blaptoides fortunei]